MFPRRVRGRGRLISAGGPTPIFSAPLTTSLLAGSANGSGTPTFSRASAAYVPDFEGVMRSALANEARFWGARRVYNGLTYSQDFANAAWIAGFLTGPPSGAYSDPMGGTAAQMLQEETSGTPQYHNIYQDTTQMPVSGRRYVTSIYAKNGSGRGLQLQVVNSSTGADGAYIVVDLTNGSIFAPATALGAATAAAGYVETLANGWYRINVSVTWPAGTTGNVRVIATLYNIGAVLNLYPGTAGYCYIFGAQCEDATGSANTAAPAEYVASNVVASPYYGCGVDAVKCFDTVRVHTQNMLLQSGTFATPWGFVDATLAVSGTAGPAGLSAYSLTDNTNNASHRATQSVLVATATGRAFKFSCYLKNETKNTALILITDSVFSNRAALSITDLTAGTFSFVASGLMTGSATLTDVGNGWWLAEVTALFPVDPTTQVFGGIYMSSAAPLTSYVGTNQSILIAGASLRQNTPSISSTYVATTSAAAPPTYTGTLVPIPNASLLGYLAEGAGTQLVTPTASIRLVSDASWVKVGAPTIATTYGVDGSAGACNQITSTAGNTTILQTLVAAASVRSFSAYIKRIAGTGNIELTQDGATWTNIAGSLVAGQWVRVSLTASQLNASFGVRIVTSGDSIAMDFMQFENGINTGPTTPMPTAGASRAVDSLVYASANNVIGTVGSVYAEFFPGSSEVNSNNVIDVSQNELLCFANNGAAARIYDGTSSIQSTGGAVWFPPSARKSASSWGAGARSVVNSGGILASGAFDGDMNPTAIRIGRNGATSTSGFGGIRNVKIFGVKLTDPQLTAMVA